MERLTRRNVNGVAVYNTPSGEPIKWENNRHEVLQKLAEYEDLEEQGKLPRLPCAVGDTVYTNDSMRGWYFRKSDRPYKAKVVFIGVNGGDGFINIDLGKGLQLQFDFSDFGKTVFLTKEEAKFALKEVKA